MSEAFEKWWAGFMETDEYKSDSYHWDKAAKDAFNAGIDAAADVAEGNADLHSYCGCDLAIRKLKDTP